MQETPPDASGIDLDNQIIAENGFADPCALHRGVAQPMRGDLPYPEGSPGGPQPQIEGPV
jgi:hypothetical protein